MTLYYYEQWMDLSIYHLLTQILDSNLTLYNGDSVQIITHVTSPSGCFALVKWRNSYSVGNSTVTGKLTAYVDGSPAIPTIGKVTNPKSTNIVGAPSLLMGTTLKTDSWDTTDTAKSGTTTYLYNYSGQTIAIGDLFLAIFAR